MQKSIKRLFLILTAIIVISDLIFVTINYRADQDSLETSLRKQAVNFERSLNLTQSLVYENMLQLASFIGSDREVQQLFLQGRDAVAQEGGGAGGAQAAEVRQRLYQKVAPSWNNLMERFDARQLHFHLGPGSLSFLRVHKPGKFGDRMDDVRHIIVDTYADQQSKTGFETGRVYSGLRGTVPIVAERSGEQELVGVLEVGTSYKTVLQKLKQRAGVESVVLLNEDHVQGIMWPEFIESKLKRLLPGSPCFVEAASSLLAVEVLQSCQGLSADGHGPTVTRRLHQEREYAIIRIPLSDYYSEHRAEGRGGSLGAVEDSLDAVEDSVGAVVIVTDITQQVELTREHLRANIQIALVGFVIIELLLFFGLRLAVTRLQAMVEKRTAQLQQLKDYYEDQSQHDGLTGLYNHRTLIELMNREVGRSQRYGEPLSLLMLDLDHFKHINDHYGHGVGDQVLEAVAAEIERLARQTDIAARYGGEEFCLLLPNTPLIGALELAQRLLAAIREVEICIDGKVIGITSSAGVAQWSPVQSASDFINAADTALYRAKHSGRDRACVASYDSESETEPV
ncbi:diguanylate cyclase [Candidatus Pelagadaptatus aseana]|uniref:sensor domain-containing diguanylate cyclase n=1 Tax=Candidatus Pelagadaptatus aseana TaxID=3120508 RepID=UPI003C6F1120